MYQVNFRPFFFKEEKGEIYSLEQQTAEKKNHTYYDLVKFNLESLRTDKPFDKSIVICSF